MMAEKSAKANLSGMRRTFKRNVETVYEYRLDLMQEAWRCGMTEAAHDGDIQ